MITGISHAQRRQYFYANLLVDYAAAKEIRLFGLGGFFRQRMMTELCGVHRAAERVDRRALAVHVGLALLGALTATGGLLWAVLAALHGQLTIGDLSVLVAALTAASSSLRAIITSVAMTSQALLMFRSYAEVVAERADLKQPPRPVQPGTPRRGIELDDVWFRYGPGQPWVLRGVSLFIPHGQAIALVGRNGAGKSTLVKLLCRFYDPDRGVIRWDDTDLRDIDIAGLRQRISVVFQDFVHYELSAAENIAVGDLDRADSRLALMMAAERSGIHAVLAALPKGYDTMLTRTYFDLADRDNPETGVLLSGGQWQRLGLARALLRGDRDLLILDEPSSGLDAEAEYEIHTSLRAQRTGHATLLISHRLNTVRDADHIVVLDDGVVCEQGSHDALMARGGLYASLFTRQAEGYTREPARSAAAADG
jgi:ATP-binding cassette subfamily B protein